MSIIRYSDLPKISRQNKNKKIIFCSGSFDLTHAGHALFFEDCKKHGDILVVGIGGDKTIRKNKSKDRPILNQQIRMKMVDSLKPVDYTFLNTISDKEPSFSLNIIENVLKMLKPYALVINEDAFGISAYKQITKKHNTNLLILKRWCPKTFNRISTTKIIEKIKKL